MSTEEVDHVSCGELVFDKPPVISIDHTVTLDKAINLLAEKHILSLPIRDDSSCDSESGPYIGVIDILDILMVVSYGESKQTPPKTPDEMLREITVEEAMGVADELIADFHYSSVFTLDRNQSLGTALNTLIGGVERALVKVSDSPAKFKVLSQLDALAWLHVNANRLAVCGETIADAGLDLPEAFNELCTVSVNTTALEGFRRMIQNKADAVAVVTPAGKLMSTLSPSDLRYLFQTNDKLGLDTLKLPIKDFLLTIHGALRKPVSITRSCSVRQAMSAMVACRIHRVWVVDEHNTPVGCVRVQDVLVKFSHLDYKHPKETGDE